nr:hypothetical protein [Tanacetum cinerariifolium]
MESKTKAHGLRMYDMVNRKWKTLRPNVARFLGVHANVMRQAQTSGAKDEDYFPTTLLDYEAKRGKKYAKRYKTSRSSSFNTKTRNGSINKNVDAGEDEEDEVQELERPMGMDKAKCSKKKGLGSSSSMNNELLARLMVSELAMHNERSMAMKKEECLTFLEIIRMDMEIRERELAMHEYKQCQKDIMFYMQPYNHLTVDALNRMEE